MARFYLIGDIVGLDVKLGLRLMRKSWGLTLVGGVAMALTIGLGTAIFTLWNTATTTTLPLPDGDRIVAIQSSDAATQQIHRDSSLPDFIAVAGALAVGHRCQRHATRSSVLSSLRVARPVRYQLPR